MIRIVYHRAKCIGCNSCSDLSPDLWTIDESDGKSNLTGAKETKKNIFILNNEVADPDLCIQTSENCPVNIIEVSVQ